MCTTFSLTVRMNRQFGIKKKKSCTKQLLKSM